jgi:hypothetical protein
VISNYGASLNIVLSRTRLERLIKDFDLYAREATSVLDHGGHRSADARRYRYRHVWIARKRFVIKYTGTDPVTVMKVTERIAALLRDEGMMQQERAGGGWHGVPGDSDDDTGRRIKAIIAGSRARQGSAVTTSGARTRSARSVVTRTC